MTVLAPDARARLLARAEAAGITIGREVERGLSAYHDLLARWNRRINLTSLTDSDADLDRLLLEPLAAALHIGRDAKLLDIGSGGGSPAIPLRIARPDLMLTMVEPRARKAAFLREACRQLSLTGCSVEQTRYEDFLSRVDRTESFDVVTVRALRVDQYALSNIARCVTPDGSVMLFHSPGANVVGGGRCVTLLPAGESQLTVFPRAALLA